MYFTPLPSQTELRGLLDYDPATGIFTWRPREGMVERGRWAWNKRFAGKPAGTRHEKGWIIRIYGANYYLHRLAWVYVHGDIPKGMQIDHINCDHFDNRVANLRLATHSDNLANLPARKRALPKGVKRNGSKFAASISIQNKSVHIGTFKTPELAHAAYLDAARKRSGQFARGA